MAVLLQVKVLLGDVLGRGRVPIMHEVLLLAAREKEAAPREGAPGSRGWSWPGSRAGHAVAEGAEGGGLLFMRPIWKDSCW